MNEMQLMIIGMIAKVGLESAIIILKNISKVVTVDDAITALKVAQSQTWEDFKKNA